MGDKVAGVAFQNLSGAENIGWRMVGTLGIKEKNVSYLNFLTLVYAFSYVCDYALRFMRQQGDLQYFRPALCVVCKPNAKDATTLCGRVNSWICINFAKNAQDNLARGFCHELAQMCQISGMEFSLDPVLLPLTAQPDHVERALSTCYHDAMTILQPQGKELDLLIVILPDNDGSLYGSIDKVS
ncbi:hypothetical protein ZIOFF_034879 [Zingiber officinale]|uniref:Uncharacterized protein n=1 Tax=Zingiber officinale TaxID=94328 RepID=A0A8J5GFE9_ZINOF|nr:hypothetical protein ZIOFF_034879 [Zingiber officinale]